MHSESKNVVTRFRGIDLPSLNILFFCSRGCMSECVRAELFLSLVLSDRSPDPHCEWEERKKRTHATGGWQQWCSVKSIGEKIFLFTDLISLWDGGHAFLENIGLLHPEYSSCCSLESNAKGISVFHCNF